MSRICRHPGQFRGAHGERQVQLHLLRSAARAKITQVWVSTVEQSNRNPVHDWAEQITTA
jgi:hypothetical protein